MNETILSVQDFRKVYGNFVAVDGIRFQVQRQTSGLPANMRVDEAMRFFCAYHGVAPRYDLLERLGLKEKQRSQFRELSTGQQRRLALALAGAPRPPGLILDA